MNDSERRVWMGNLESFLALMLGMAFLGTGVAKFVGTDWVIATFGGWDLPAWTLLAIGAAEIAAAILILIPTTRWVGAVQIGSIMVGALVYHASRGETALMAIPVSALLATILLGLVMRARVQLSDLQPVPVQLRR
jgi:uncharacterized membrane protein YphA (DoxX/SURF4 family)